MRIEILGGWNALLVETGPHGTVLRQGSAEFDRVEYEITAWERSGSRAGWTGLCRHSSRDCFRQDLQARNLDVVCVDEDGARGGIA